MMRNPYASVLDFAELQGVIPENPKWIPSDLDMIMERKGKYLLCEWKRECEDFGGGQKILLKSLAKHPDFTVLIVQGDTDSGMSVTKFWLLDGNKLQLKGKSTDAFKSFILNWYREVDKYDKSF